MFAATAYPGLSHLCLPGDFLNCAPKGSLGRVRRYGVSQQFPPPRPTPLESRFQWPLLGWMFPSLTHLYLPRLFLPPTDLGVQPHTLVKLSLVQSPPIPLSPILDLVRKQTVSLRSLHFGYISIQPDIAQIAFEELGEALASCKLEEFRLCCGESKDSQAVKVMRQNAVQLLTGLRSSWRSSLTVSQPGRRKPKSG